MVANRRTVCLAGMLLIAGSVAAADDSVESWLTPSEQEFFAALGLDAKVQGKSIQRKPRYEALPDIGQRAPEPLRGRILAMAGEFSHLSLTPEEKQEFSKLSKKAAEKYRDELRQVVAGTRTPEEVGSEIAKQGGPFREFSNQYAQWVAREVQARETIAKNLNAITSDLEKRSGGARPEADLLLAVASAGPTVSLTGKAGVKPVESAIVQVTIHKAKADIGPMLDLAASAWLVRQGVDNILPSPEKLDVGAGAESAAATAIKTKSFNMPIVKTFGLPRIAPGQRVSIDLDEDLNDVIFFEKLSLKVWTAEGAIIVDEVPGLAAAVKYREQVSRDERFKEPAINAPDKNASTAPNKPPKPARAKPEAARSTGTKVRGPAARSSDPPRSAFGGKGRNDDAGREMKGRESKVQAEREEQAQEALQEARAAMARQQNDAARGHLKRAMSLAPDSRAASAAKALLKRLER